MLTQQQQLFLDNLRNHGYSNWADEILKRMELIRAKSIVIKPFFDVRAYRNAFTLPRKNGEQFNFYTNPDVDLTFTASVLSDQVDNDGRYETFGEKTIVFQETLWAEEFPDFMPYDEVRSYSYGPDPEWPLGTRYEWRDKIDEPHYGLDLRGFFWHPMRDFLLFENQDIPVEVQLTASRAREGKVEKTDFNFLLLVKKIKIAQRKEKFSFAIPPTGWQRFLIADGKGAIFIWSQFGGSFSQMEFQGNMVVIINEDRTPVMTDQISWPKEAIVLTGGTPDENLMKAKNYVLEHQQYYRKKKLLK